MLSVSHCPLKLRSGSPEEVRLRKLLETVTYGPTTPTESEGHLFPPNNVVEENLLAT